MDKINLEVISQERAVLKDTVDAVVAPASEGEVTILPHHIPFITKLNAGEIKIIKAGKVTAFIIGDGFMEVNPKSEVTILTNAATKSEAITLAQAEAAKRRAEALLRQKLSRREALIAEAELRKALFELKVARRRRRSTSILGSE